MQWGAMARDRRSMPLRGSANFANTKRSDRFDRLPFFAFPTNTWRSFLSVSRFCLSSFDPPHDRFNFNVVADPTTVSQPSRWALQMQWEGNGELA
jgi:hypothetical protein